MREQLDIERERNSDLLKVIVGSKSFEEDESGEVKEPQKLYQASGWGNQQMRLRKLSAKNFQEWKEKNAIKEAVAKEE